MSNQKNMHIHHFKDIQVCDAHVHINVENSLAETVEIFNKIIHHFNYEKIAINSLPLVMYNQASNYNAFYCKSKIGGAYVNAGIMHRFNSLDTSEYYLDEIKKYHVMGCDGMKMIEGKPDNRKLLGKRLDDKDFDKYYEYAEENQIPIIMHWGDPAEFWDVKRIPEWALERGWLYDDSYPPYKEFRGEAEGFLKKFPKLKITFAHFFFTSDDIEYAHKIMETYENVTFDLTPGSEMYKNFDASSDAWRNFFLKYSDRILYGTDIYNWKPEGKTTEERYSHAVNLQRSFLEKDTPFYDLWTETRFENPFGFDEEVLQKIYNTNFKCIWGKSPRTLDVELIAFECKRFLASADLSSVEAQNMQKIISEFENA